MASRQRSIEERNCMLPYELQKGNGTIDTVTLDPKRLTSNFDLKLYTEDP